MKISNINFPEKPLFLAPMEDVTDPAFRLLCKRFGADMMYTEFVSSEALIRSVNRTQQKLTIYDEERPIAIQIYGYSPDSMAEAARIAAEAKPDIIDINFGCPVKKVAGKTEGKSAGAGLLRDVPRMLAITRAVVDAVKIPVTAKTRLGWDDGSKIIVDLAERLQDCGIAALTIHGRTRAQMYRGEADWTLIGEVKNNQRMKIPIVGNGDVTTPERAAECFERYGVDAVMIGRGAIGQPWIFGEMKDFLEQRTKNKEQRQKTEDVIQKREYKRDLSFEDKKSILKEYILASIKCLDNVDIDIFNFQFSIFNSTRYKGIIHSRRHLAATPIFKGIANFRETRIRMLRAETLNELFEIIDGVELKD
ncbi:MAG: tRNA dihydrouridine synthase DusB [Paludibacter sp.]|jgi:nifR3 family TIM-barrel protein|nr:tRNA dihydrouridine synthase DusB [Paludibacter sp.]